jgi:DNA-binding response OmpR family regulator
MKKVLVVDDDKNIADLTEMILGSAGYDCTKLNDGRSCLDAIRNGKNNKSYDLVLLDVAMPGFSGMDVITVMRQEGYLERNRVAFFTASSATQMEVNNFEKLGAIGCLNKPFTKAELLNFVGMHTSE